ncbi:thioesterase superfamily protein [Thermoanaerobacterium thermosaccharolyticum DSM 571]|uniref:Thioesterase superfamily protein n=1 Tax=Thermoanaerobacterium thermosaccharolyticum (strain ATCC 7956 / DSM 571 / NCIMB 9385 / NCA 3814 / NCTC 13789 / WDCM 00135 / 2032) TaxID=580327 RepID=D9TTK6_THETC|nr:PaaI family thioesterase [Thermoanaerobacterium thermosaccharolyticum]ADL68263.1 thioesterase superfamily protein [Thermoanaerobacterium thermosaccharolyticum DSM 571]
MEVRNNGINEDLFKKIIESNKNAQYHNLIGMDIVELDSGKVTMEMMISEKHLNIFRIAHGGVLFSLMDTAMGIAAKTMGRNMVTLEMNINYIKSVKAGDKIKAFGKIIHLGKSTAVAVCDAYNQDGKLVASARETFYGLN